MDRSVVTLDRHIVEQERRHPEATGAFSSILQDLALAGKLINRQVRKAGLVDILGQTGRQNVHGDEVRKLDEFAHDVVFRAMDHGGHLCIMASEEEEDPLAIPEEFPTGDYALLYDPLDGSSNIDVNISIGTIFSLHERVSQGRDGTRDDLLQPGHRQQAAGYIIYGSSTMLVYTTGNGVHGFTLDPSIGEFLLSHPDIRIPNPGDRVYSVNEGHADKWSDAQRELVAHLKRGRGRGGGGFSGRYVGSLVADFHRTLLNGGLFMYPGNRANPEGKLRLLYEAAPMAMICEEAGGRASDGERDILSLNPQDLHQRTPLFIGSSAHVDLVEERLAGA